MNMGANTTARKVREESEGTRINWTLYYFNVAIIADMNTLLNITH